ncbi:MAG TPA: sensor histidine kinase [Micromonosporaceae bacterium]
MGLRAGIRGLKVRDWIVAILAAVAMLVRTSLGPAVTAVPAGAAAAAALAIIGGACLVCRRHRPWIVASVLVVVSAAIALLAGPGAPVAGWLAVIVASRHVPGLTAALRGGTAMALATAAGSTVGSLVHDATSGLPLWLLATLVVLLASALARLQAARAEAQRRQRDVEQRQAVTGERLRIARDLHDLVGHGLSTVAVQSGAARTALQAGDPTTALRALGEVEAATRAALAEMRQMLGVLRHGEQPDAPAPGLDGIDPLADAARAAGHRVTVTMSGALDAVPPAAALCAYRVVQEALTNVVRHAPRAAVDVSLAASGRLLTVEVTDDGTGGASAVDPHRPRYGLAGMRERVAAAGGTVDAGRRSGVVGWRVAARLPLTEGNGMKP